MDHPPHSAYLILVGFWLFPKLKNALKGQRFADIPNIQQNVTRLLQGTQEYGFQGNFWQWQQRTLVKFSAIEGPFRK
jgi:hypothetical protein